MASLSLQSEVMRGSASSSLPYITSAMPTASPDQQQFYHLRERVRNLKEVHSLLEQLRSGTSYQKRSEQHLKGAQA
jgi:hypothetical protein